MSYADELEWYLELGITIGCLILVILVTFFVCYCFCTGPRRESAMVLDSAGTYQLMMGSGGDYQEGARVEPHKSHGDTAAHPPTNVAQSTHAQSGLAAPLTTTTATGLPSTNGVRSSAGTGDGSFIQTAATVVGAPSSYDSAAPHTAQSSASSRPPLSPAESSASHNTSAMPRRKSSANLSSLHFHEEHRHETLSSSSSELLGGATTVGGFDHHQQRRGSGSATQTQTSTGGGRGDSNPFRHQLELHGQHFGSVDGFDEL